MTKKKKKKKKAKSRSTAKAGERERQTARHHSPTAVRQQAPPHTAPVHVARDLHSPRRTAHAGPAHALPAHSSAARSSAARAGLWSRCCGLMHLKRCLCQSRARWVLQHSLSNQGDLHSTTFSIPDFTLFALLRPCSCCCCLSHLHLCLQRSMAAFPFLVDLGGMPAGLRPDIRRRRSLVDKKQEKEKYERQQKIQNKIEIKITQQKQRSFDRREERQERRNEVGIF